MSPCRSASSSSRLRWSVSQNTNFSFGPRYVVVNLPGDLCRSDRERRRGAPLSRRRRQDRKAVADADGRDHQRRAQSDLDGAGLDREGGNLRAYAQGSRLSLAHAHGGARRARPADRSAFGGLVRYAHAEFHGAPAVRHLQCARRRQDRHAESLFGLYARHATAQSLRQRLPLRLPWLLARRQCARPRGLAAQGPAEMESRGDRCDDRQPASISMSPSARRFRWPGSISRPG